MKNSPSGKLPLKPNPLKRLPLAQPANFVAPSFDDNPEDPNQALLDRSDENMTPQTNPSPLKPSTEEKLDDQIDSSSAFGNLFVEREDQGSQYSRTEKMKASQGASQTSSENNEIPKKNNYQHLPPIRKIATKITRDGDESPNPLIQKGSLDTERENSDKSPTSAAALLIKETPLDESPTKENNSEKKESAFKKNMNKINPEMELVTIKPMKVDTQNVERKKSKQVSILPATAEPTSQLHSGTKLGSVGLTGVLRLDSEGQDDEEENNEGRSPISYKTRTLKHLGSIFKDKNKPKSKKYSGLNLDEEKSKTEKIKVNPHEGILSKENMAKIKSAVWKRRIARFIFLGIYLAIAAAIVIAAFLSLIERGQYSDFTHTKLNFTLDNCTFQIFDHQDASINSPIYFKYQVPKETTGPRQVKIHEPPSGSPYQINIISQFDASYCRLELYVKKDTPLDSLSFHCITCHIVQDTSFQLQVTNELYIYGDRQVNANFRDIKVNKFTYKAKTGYIQLSNIESSSQVNEIDLHGEGDIILQSTGDFQVNITSGTEAFCLYAPVVESVGTGSCGVSGGANRTVSSSEDCQVIYKLSSSASSSPLANYNINSRYSNVYANIIPRVGYPAAWEDASPTMGRVYEDGINLSKTAGEAVINFDDLITGSSKGNPFIILDIGNIISRSSRFMRWVLSSTPSYSLLRPWWIGTLSATILNGYTEKVTGYLLPGICPYVPQYTIEDHYLINSLLQNNIASEDTLFTFVKDNGLARPPEAPQPSSGIFYYSESRNPFDEWLSLTVSSNIEISVQNNSYADRPTILASVVASIIIAIIIAYLVLLLVMKSVNLIYTKLMEFTGHLQNYAKLENREAETESEANSVSAKKKRSTNSFKNFLDDSPSPIAFLDYMVLILYRQYTNSVTQFYHELFKEINPSQDQELDPRRDMLKGTEAKALYEKFCFLKNISEQKLTDKKNLNILKTFGFEIVTRSDVPCEVFTKIKIKNREAFLSSTPQEEKVDSLQIYMDENIERTEFDEDQVEVDDFIQSYYRYCDHNRFSRVIVYPSLMKERFDINHAVIPQQFIVRIQNQEEDFLDEWAPTRTLKLNNLLKPALALNNKYYIIDTVRLQNHLNLVMDKISEFNQNELSEATVDLILFKGHLLWDALSVFIHLLGGALVPIPVILFVMLMNTQYEPWSVKEPHTLIWFGDILRDPLTLVQNIYLNFTWNTVIMVIMSVLVVLSFIDLLLSYFVMEFPQDKTFRKSHLKSENFLQKLSRQIQWGFVLLMLFFYFTYIGLLLTWLLLGAFINPNAFLPFASSAVTFMTFFIAKYKAFQLLTKQGSEIIMKHLEAFFNESMKNVLGKLVEGAEKVASSVNDKAKGLLQSEGFNSATNQLADLGIIDSNLIDEYKTKIQDLDSQAIIEGGIAVIKDRNVLLRQMNDITNSLKEKAVERVSEECRKRKMPEPAIKLVTGIYTKNNDQVRKAVEDLLQGFIIAQKMPEESVEILLDLLFPQGGDKNSIARSIGYKVVKMISTSLQLEEKIPDFNPQVLLNTLMEFQNLEDFNSESYLSGLRQLTRGTSYDNVISNMGPVMELISALSAERPKYWKVKEPALELLKSAVRLLTNDQENMIDFSENTFDSFADFISMLSANYGEHSLEPLHVLRTIGNFCGATGLNKAFYDKNQISGEFIPSLIYLTLSYTRPETYQHSKESIQSLAEAFKLRDLGNNDFLPFSFELVSTINYDFEQSEERINKCIDNYEIHPKLGEFIKIIAFYGVNDFESTDHNKGVQNNSYFIRMAQKVEIQPQELLGLIDLIYGKKNSKFTRAFLEAIMKRMDIKREKLKKLEPIINLFMSHDETVVLEAAKALSLAQRRFLLIGKGILNPKFLSVQSLREIGVKTSSVFNNKDTVYDPDNEDEQWLRWKEQLRDDIIPKEVSPFATKDATPKRKQVPVGQESPYAKLVSFYMNDWEKLDYSHKNIAAFLSILDPEKTLDDSEKGAMTSYINFLSVVLPIASLRLKKRARYEQFNKDQEAAIKKIADCLNIKIDPLRTSLKMFVISDEDVISNSFSFFFQDKIGDLNALDKALAYSFKQVSIMNDKTQFLNKTLPKSIRLTDDDLLSFPGGVIKNIKNFGGSSKESLSITDILELSSIIIRKLDRPALEQEELIDICYKLGLFAKSLLTKQEIVEVFKIKDHGILNLFSILTESDPESRIAQIVDIFPDDNNPLKLAMALYAILSGQNPMVKNTTKAGFLRRNKPAAEKESIKTYLSEMFKIDAQIFDIFEISFERNEALFIQKAMPLIRRITKSSLIDVNLMESLLSISLGHRFSTGYLSNRLKVSSDTLDFFISMLGLANPERRKDELAILSKSSAAKNVLKRLDIELPEFVALIRLVFNIFNDGDNDEEKLLLKTFTDLGFKTVESSRSFDNETIEMERFKGFMSLSKPIDPKLKDKKRITNLKTLKTQTDGFFSAFSLTPDDAFIISRITIGDFLVIQQYPERLDWVFPSNNQKAASVLMDLTMGICGLVNPHVKITSDLDKQISGFVDPPTSEKGSSDSMPTNTLGYAIHLTYSTLDIAPFWTQAFMFDKEAYSKLAKNLPEIKSDFVLAIVTNFLDMSEAARDILGFYEWNKAYRAFMTENEVKCNDTVLYYAEEYVSRFFGDKFNFDYDRTQNLVDKFNVGSNSSGKRWIRSQKYYTYNINKTLWHLLASKCNFLQDTVDEHLSKSPSEFLVELAKSYKGRKRFPNSKQERLAVGQVVKLAIELCYLQITIEFTGKPQRISGYQLLDLSVLGTIMGLRDSATQKIPYERQLYNLHQLTMNVERKLFLEDHFYKMSKFKLMKLVGISLGMQVSNIVEWCLPPSLFVKELVKKLDLEKTHTQRQDLRLRYCKKLDKQFDAVKKEVVVGDLGKFGGTDSDYINLLEPMLKTDDWESINTLLALSEKYLGDPNADPKKSEQQIKKLIDGNKLLGKSKIDQIGQAIYLPLELLVQKYNKNYFENLSLNRIHSKKSDKKEFQLIPEEKDPNVNETLKDAKTSLPYSVLEQKYKEFEKTLTHANMGLIQGVINGDPSVMLRGKHDIVESDPEKKTKAKLYMALIGLQTFQKGERTDRKRLEEYLHPISQKMQSEKSKIRSLLLFIITAQPDLKEIISSLDLSDEVVDLLFVSLKKNSQTDKSDSEDSSMFGSFQDLLKISEVEMEAFQIVQNIYQFELYDGWLPLIEILSKVEIPDISLHPLTTLFEMINFDKLKVSSKSLSGQGILNFLKSGPSEQTNTLLTICKKVCKKHSLLSRIDDETLTEIYQALESIAKHDFSNLFKTLILPNDKKETDTPKAKNTGKKGALTIYNPDSLLENLLYFIGVDTRSVQSKKDMKLVRIFLTMANGDFKSIKKTPNYKDIMNSIIDTVLESGLFASYTIDQSIQRSLGQMLLGALSWDLEIIMGALINKHTLPEAYFVYNLFGCLNSNKIYQGKNSGAQMKKHLNVVLSTTIQNIASNFDISNLNTLADLIDQDFGNVDPEKRCKVLTEKMENIMKTVQNFDSTKDQNLSFLQNVAKTLRGTNKNSSLAQVFSNSEEDSEKDLYENLIDILTSICDGTLLTELINGFIKDDDWKTFLNELIQFILKLVLTLQEKKQEHKQPLFTHFKALIQTINKLKPHEAWDEVIKVVPEFMKLYVNVQGRPKLNQIITEMLRAVNQLLTLLGSDQQTKLMDDIFSVVVGTDLSNFDYKDTTAELKLKFDTTAGEKTQIIFTKIMPNVYPSLETHITGDQLEAIYKTIVTLQFDFVESIRNPTKLHDIAYEIAQLLEPFGYCNADFIDDIRGILRGRIACIYYLLEKVMPTAASEHRDEIRSYLMSAESLFNVIPGNRSLQLDLKPNGSAIKGKKADARDWGALMEKIKEGTGLVKELFDLVDQEGDGSGKISIEEFHALASRLGLKLSQHRITEIFAKVKGNKVSRDGNKELNEKEFEKALTYLEEKNLYHAMEMLGITPENLGLIFIVLIFLLVLIFIFIFLGIQAFTIGGTFGAVINSMFPAVGGLSLAKKSDSSKEKLEDENVENAAETAYNINASEDL